MSGGSPSRDAATVLIFEPDVELRRYLIRSLMSLARPRLRLVEADTLEAACRALRRQEIDLVVAALEPSSGPPELCRELGAGGQGQTPVLLLAAGVGSVIEGRDVVALERTTIMQGSFGALSLSRAVEKILHPPLEKGDQHASS